MRTKDAIKYFGSIKNMADFLGIWPHTPYRWGEYVPLATACLLHIRTQGRLDVGLDDYGLHIETEEEYKNRLSGKPPPLVLDRCRPSYDGL